MAAGSPLRHELLRAAPYAVVLAILLGAVVVTGANLSNAFPSEKAPYGWPGPSKFDNAVAMVRSDLVLAASLPALALGAMALRGRSPHDLRAGGLWQVALPHMGLLGAAAFVAGGIGAVGASKTAFASWLAFSTAHALLALAFYSLGFLWSALLREWALAGAVATWVFFLGVYEGVIRTILFRTAGYHDLAAGAFPTWFYVAQGFSPLAAYRGVLILWRRGFMDYLESNTIGVAELPGWINPGTFAALLVGLWVVLPLGVAALAWWWQGRDAAAAPRRAPEKAA